MQTKNLIGAALDWAVAKCDAIEIKAASSGWVFNAHHHNEIHVTHDCRWHKYSPSTDWAQGGPIIEREAIQIFRNVGGTYSARIRHEEDHPLVAYKVLAGFTNSAGPTMLVAAMRCYVASKLGENIELPEELK